MTRNLYVPAVPTSSLSSSSSIVLIKAVFLGYIQNSGARRSRSPASRSSEWKLHFPAREKFGVRFNFTYASPRVRASIGLSVRASRDIHAYDWHQRRRTCPSVHTRKGTTVEVGSYGRVVMKLVRIT